MSQQSWWGDFELPMQTSGAWRVGPLELRITHTSREWRVAWRRDEGADDGVELRLGLPAEDLPDDYDRRRFGFARTAAAVRLAPALSDRPFVSRPAVPFAVPPGQELALVVTTPLWLGVVAEGLEAPLVEVPVLRPSDTWFGPNTREGQLCYASRTHLRPADDPGEVPAWRALSTVRIQNRGADALMLERLSLPVPQLRLYVDAGGAFRTSSLLLERQGGEQARVTIAPDPPDGATPVAPPRLDESSGGFVVARVFNSLFA